MSCVNGFCPLFDLTVDLTVVHFIKLNLIGLRCTLIVQYHVHFLITAIERKIVFQNLPIYIFFCHSICCIQSLLKDNMF